MNIQLTGRYAADFGAANEAAGLGRYGSRAPTGYVWHHLDFDPISGEGTLQLVDQTAHRFWHAGGVSGWEAYFGISYK